MEGAAQDLEHRRQEARSIDSQRVAEMGHAAGEARGGRKFKREWVLRCGGVGLWAPGSIITAESLIHY